MKEEVEILFEEIVVCDPRGGGGAGGTCHCSN